MNEQEFGVVEQVQDSPEVQVGTAMGWSSQMEDRLAKLHRTIRIGANWFYWTAVFSIINTVLAIFDQDGCLALGLGVMQFADALIRMVGPRAVTIALPISLFVVAVYVMFGYCAARRMRWAFYAGAYFYSVDGLLLVLVKDWWAVALHAWVLYWIIRGIIADAEARQLEAQMESPVL